MSKLNFSGHQTFTLRYSWIPKAVEALESGANLLDAEDAMLRFGVGKNMVGSIVHWLIVTDVAHRVNDGLRLTSLGRNLFGVDGYDPYLEDLATHWLLHWNVASRPEYASTCYWMFNELRQMDFTERHVMRGIEQWVASHDRVAPSPNTLKRDIDCYLRTYVPLSRSTEIEDWVDCPFGELGLLMSLAETDNERWYRFSSDAHRTLPDWILHYAVEDYWWRNGNAKESLSFEDVIFRPGSPGRVFKIGPDAMVSRLEQLETGGGLMLKESSGVRNLYRTSERIVSDIAAFLPKGSTRTTISTNA
jgi:Protein of unknown function (DUF4007)